MKYLKSSIYVLKYELNFAPEYKWTKDGICINTKTGREIKKVLNNRCAGYCIRGKFVSLSTLRNQLKQIDKNPF